MQAIQTKYLPATNTRGSRIKATCERGSITIDYPHDLSGDEVHREAVRQLIAKFVKEDAKEYGTHDNSWNQPFLTGFHDNIGYHIYPAVGSNAVLIQCADEPDASEVAKFAKACRTASGTVSGLRAGLACSALKRSITTAIPEATHD